MEGQRAIGGSRMGRGTLLVFFFAGHRRRRNPRANPRWSGNWRAGSSGAHHELVVVLQEEGPLGRVEGRGDLLGLNGEVLRNLRRRGGRAARQNCAPEMLVGKGGGGGAGGGDRSSGGARTCAAPTSFLDLSLPMANGGVREGWKCARSWRARSWASNVRRAFCARRAGKKREKALPWAAVGAGSGKPTQRAEIIRPIFANA